MKHIGILAHSAEGSALCYLAACHEGARLLGPHMHPHITMDIIPMGASMGAWENNDLESIRATLLETVRRLAAAGCDFFICPDNTAHLALERPGEPFPLPGLHIAEPVAEQARTRNYKKIGVLATKWTMEGPIYRGAFARAGCESCIPGPEDRAFVNRVIFDELCNGVIRDESRDEYLRIISGFKDEGSDAVVLGCTEIPLLITPELSPLPTLDSTRLLAVAAIEAAIGKRDAPSWRGGPVLSG